jgi:hypothetical protein
MAIVATRRGHSWNRRPCQHFRIIWMDFWSRSAQWVGIYESNYRQLDVLTEV